MSFHIPETAMRGYLNVHSDLTMAYLGMFFAFCDAFHHDTFYADFMWKEKECDAVLDLLEEFATERLMLRGVSLEYNVVLAKADVRKPPKLGPLKFRKIKGHIAVQMLEKIFQNYKAMEQLQSIPGFS